jgi:hypothetical protein
MHGAKVKTKVHVVIDIARTSIRPCNKITTVQAYKFGYCVGDYIIVKSLD